MIEQLSAPESLTDSANDAVLDGTELALLALSWRNELARFSNTFLRPWHKSSHSPYLLDGWTPEFPAAGSTRRFSVVAGAGVADTGVSAAGVAAPEIADTEVAGAGCEAGAGAERGCGATDFADADSSKDFAGGTGFCARFSDEFSQKEILAVPSVCRIVCRCNGHCPR